MSAVFVWVSFLSDAGAQEKAEYDYTQEVDTWVRDIPSRSAEDQSGHVGITESEFEYAYQPKLFGQLPVKLSIDSRDMWIDNSTAVDLPSHLTGVTAGVETTVPVFTLEHAYFHLGVFPSFYSDNWTFGSENFRIPSKYYFIYVLNDKWTFVAGAAVYPRYDTNLSPILGFIYKPNDKLTFYLVPDRPNVSYALTDRLTLFAEGWDKTDDEYIVDRGTAKNVTLKYAEGHLGTGIRFKLTQDAQIILSGGEIFNNYLDYLDGNGKVDMKNGPYVELRFTMKI